MAAGKQSRRVESQQRERADAHYRARKQAAREELAHEMLQAGPPTLAQLRLSQGLSQSELAVRMGTSQAHIAKIEAGKVELYFRTAIKLSNALSVSLDTIKDIVEISDKSEVSLQENTVIFR